jgi:hypothetical protein
LYKNYFILKYNLIVYVLYIGSFMMKEFKTKKFTLYINETKQKSSSLTWISLSRKKKDDDIFIYMSYTNGRVYSSESENSKNVKFNDDKNEFTYIWKGMYETELKTKIKREKKKFVFRMVLGNSDYKKIKNIFNLD